MQQTVTLKANSDFRRIYSRGKSFVTGGLVIYVLKNRESVNRMGITVAKKIGNAVQRNRAKRIIREAYRQVEGNLTVGHDLVLVARKKTVFLKSCDVLTMMSDIFQKAGTFKK